MISRFLSPLLLVAGLTGVAMPATADDGAAPGRVSTVTRLVRIFSTLENDLNAAIQRRDGAALDKLLASDFEMRAAAMPGRPIPKPDWMRQSMSEPSVVSHTGQMAAHEYGNTAVVSFLWNIDAATASEAARLFVVDTWVQDGGNWRLSTRYIAPVGGDAHVPGMPQDLGDLPKKY